MPDPTAYNRKLQQESLLKQKDIIISSVAKMEDKMQGTRHMNLTVVDMMDLIEEVIRSCGGEPKATFRDVSFDFIRVQTRVPISANLFQFIPDGEDNPKFHKVITKLLLQCQKVYGVRWIPDEDRGSYIIVSLNKE